MLSDEVRWPSQPQVRAAFQPILKGLRPPAQGCETRATLGKGEDFLFNPNGVAFMDRAGVLQPRWGWKHSVGIPRVARSSQPWAGGCNPFGIDRITASPCVLMKRPRQPWASRRNPVGILQKNSRNWVRQRILPRFQRAARQKLRCVVSRSFPRLRRRLKVASHRRLPDNAMHTDTHSRTFRRLPANCRVGETDP